MRQTGQPEYQASDGKLYPVSMLPQKVEIDAFPTAFGT
jgi:hypothetical protein